MKKRLVKMLRRLLEKLSPFPELKAYKPGINPSRLDPRLFQVQPGMVLSVFWKDLPHGLGPCISAYIHQYEIVRFDCFGAPLGHFHVHMPYGYVQEGRIEFSEQDIEGQLDRALFELRNNLIHWQQLFADPRIRNFCVEKDKLNAALEAATDHLNACKKAAQDREPNSQLKAKISAA